ncbi:hypothetical protein HWV62_39942, partial [Athelia sp. TMB]
MARLRTDKGRPAKPEKTQGGKVALKGKQKERKPDTQNSKAALSKADVLALGGDERDLELIGDVSDHPDGAAGEEDPELQGEVSAFLSGLRVGDAEDDAPKKATSKPKSEIKDTPKKSKPQPQPKAKPTPAAPISIPAPAPAQKRSKLLIEPTAHWYAALPPLKPAPSPTPTPTQLAQITARAADLHASALAAHQSSGAGPSSTLTSTPGEYSFLTQILASGTLSDRLSALTLLVQSAPVYNTRALETLSAMGARGKGGGGRGEGLKALRCVVDWWVGGGAPDRKLRYLRDQPLLHPSVTDGHLLVWWFEDWLKKWFFGVLQVLETLSLDPLPYVRTQSLSLIGALLRSKPEQEHNLLRLLVNKLLTRVFPQGDTEKSICARASHHLLTLVQAHPAMKSVI